MTLKTRLLGATCAAALCAIGGTAAQAGGFFIQEQSASGLGRAFAGQAAIASDATSLSYNPAAITELPSGELAVGGSVVIPWVDPDNEGTVGAGVVPIGGDDGSHADPIFVPSLQAVYPLFDRRLWVGFAATAPFGLSNEYDDDWFGRYDSTHSELVTYNLQPSLAYKVAPWLSIGGGIDIQYADADLRSALPNPLLAPFSPATDGELKVKGDDWSVGFNAGLLLTPQDGTRIGLHYRSGIDHELEGSAEISGFPGPTAALNGDTGGSADLNLPDIVSLAVAHDINPQWTVAGSVTWFNWSSFETIRVELDEPLLGGALAEIDDPQEYDDSFAVALGAEYRLSEAWTLRGGVQFDKTPVDDEFRATRVPDSDRYWLAVGASYNLNDMLSIDAGYAHIFLENADVDEVTGPVTTSASYDNSIDIATLGLRLRF